MTKHVKYETLKQTIKSREAESRAIRARIHTLSGMDKWEAWNEKRYFGSDTRYYLLAYAFMRGVPYLAVEKKCADGNYPVPTAIVNTAAMFGVETTYGAVQAWLAGEEYQPAPEPKKEAVEPPKVEPTPQPKGFIAGIKRFLGMSA